MCQQLGWLVKLEKIRAGVQTSHRFCRLPVRPQVRSGPTHTGPVAEPSRENTETAISSSLSGPAVHVLDRSTNSHRKTSSPRPTTYETHTVASSKQLESTGITGKGYSNSQVLASTSTMVARIRQGTHRSTITPNKTCSANIYRRIKRRVGCSLKQGHCKGIWSIPESKLHINYLELKAVLLTLKEF